MRQFVVLYRGSSEYTVTVEGEQDRVEDAIVDRLRRAMEINKPSSGWAEECLDVLNRCASK